MVMIYHVFVACTADTSPLDVLVDRASKRLYEMLVIGEHVTLKVTSHGTTYVVYCLTKLLLTNASCLWGRQTEDMSVYRNIHQ